MSQPKLMRIFGPSEQLSLDPRSGQLERNVSKDKPAPVQGNCFVGKGHNFALYVENKILFFQIDAKRWSLAAPDVQVTYEHDFRRKQTIFSIGDFSFEYSSWWQDDPLFQRHLPERDEDEDYLGYVYAVWRDPQLQDNLISSWSMVL